MLYLTNPFSVIPIIFDDGDKRWEELQALTAGEVISNTSSKSMDISGFAENLFSYHIHSSDSEVFDVEP